MCYALTIFASLALAARFGSLALAGRPPASGGGSPGTGKIAFVTGGFYAARLVVRNLDTGTEAVLVASATNPYFRYFMRMTWSHTQDGAGRRWIVFDAAVPYALDPTRWIDEVWAVKEDGTSLHVVIPQDGPSLSGPADPEISPDDRSIAYSAEIKGTQSSQGSGQVFDLFVQAFDPVLAQVSGTPANLTHDMFRIPIKPSYSPEGSSIAFRGVVTSGQKGDIWRLDLGVDASGQPTALNFFKLTNTSDVDEDWPDWSEANAVWPRGRIAFQGGGRLTHVNPDASNPQTITTQSGANFPSWSPQATKLAFGAIKPPPHSSFDLFSVNSDGSGLVNITNTGQVNENRPVWRPSGGSLP